MVFGVGVGIALLFLLNACGVQSKGSATGFGESLGESLSQTGFQQVDGSYELSFPLDHGSHNEYMTEWWYITSTLETPEGREFGVQFTIFRRALDPNAKQSGSWRSGQIFMAHAALSDVKSSKHYDDERISREHTELAGVAAQPFRAFLEDWSIESTHSTFSPLALRVKTESFAIDLQMTQTKPIVLQGDNGYSKKSDKHASYYYSIPRMATSGTLEIGSKTYRVEGNSWMEREWSSGLLGRQYEGWYWFAISMLDGRDLVLFSLRDGATGSDDDRVAMWIQSDGSTTPVDDNSWSIEPRRQWKQWPVEWELTIENSRFLISASFDNQEMNTSIPYWEGIVEVHQDNDRVGSGYMELTGYSP